MSADETSASGSSQSSPVFLKAISGFVSQAWITLVSLFCFPMFIDRLGIEAFGLIGWYLTLQAVLRLFDLGLTPTVIRELARAKALPEPSIECPEKIGTFETTSAVIGTVMAVSLFLGAPWLAQHWLQSVNIPTDVVAICIEVMAIQIGVNWLSNFYQSALLGLERQVLLNCLRTIEATLSVPGALILISNMAPDIRLVLFWQLGISVVALICYLVVFRNSMPTRMKTFAFRFDDLHQIRKFAGGMATISFLGLVLANMDKVFLSRFLSLEHFGYYSLAAVATTSLHGALIQPIANVMFPRLSALAASDESALKDNYHLTHQACAVIAGPVLIGVVLFGRDFIEVWTKSATIADSVAAPVAWLAIGYTLNAIMTGPYLLQIANGWTSLGVKINMLLVALFFPTLVILTSNFGLNGAAANWAAINATYLVIGLALTHTRLFPGQWRTVIAADIAPTALICIVTTGIVLALPTGSLSISARLILGVAVVLVAFVASAFASRRIRHEVLNRLRVGLHRRPR